MQDISLLHRIDDFAYRPGPRRCEPRKEYRMMRFYSRLPNAGIPAKLWDAKVRQEWPTQGLSSRLFSRIRFHGLHTWVPPAPSMKLNPQFIFSFLSRMCPQDKHVVTHLSCRFCLLCGSLWCDTPRVGKAACSPGPPSHVSAKSPGPVYTHSRLNVCGPHQIHVWKPNPQCEGVRRWGPWD